VPLTFTVIVATVAIYGLSALPVARRLKIAEPNPQGVLIIGGHTWARAVANALQGEGYKVLIVDANWANISAARMAGMATFYANILSQYALDEIELGGMGHLMALTSDDEFNSLAVLQLANTFGQSALYQLPSQSDEKDHKGKVSRHLRGRLLFGSAITYAYLTTRFSTGAVIKTTSLTEEFDYDAFQAYYGETAVPLFLIDQNGNLVIFTANNPPKPKPGQRLISLIDPTEELSAQAPPKPA
jgi:hypothetical protein